MATVRHLGLLPWCPFTSVKALTRRYPNFSYLNDALPPGDGSLWPVEMNLRQMLNLYWRVKKIKIGIGGVESTDVVIADSKEENDLVCFEPFPIVTDIGAYQEFEEGIVQASLSIIWNLTLYDPQSKTFKLFVFSDFTNDPANTYSRSDYAQSGGSGVFGGYIDFFGSKLALGTDGTYDFGVGTIEAEEYWPYNPGDGLGPIYDKVSGKQLRSFPD